MDEQIGWPRNAPKPCGGSSKPGAPNRSVENVTFLLTPPYSPIPPILPIIPIILTVPLGYRTSRVWHRDCLIPGMMTAPTRSPLAPAALPSRQSVSPHFDGGPGADLRTAPREGPAGAVIDSRFTLSIAQKLSLCFAAVLAVMLASSALVFFESEKSSRMLERMITTGYPAAISRFEILAALHETTDALRGELAFAGDPNRGRTVRASRLEAWDRLDSALKSYQEVAKHLTIQANKDRLATIEQTLPQLRDAQDEVSAIAQKGATYRGNAENTMTAKVDPLASTISDALGAMMADQRKVMGTEGAEMRGAMEQVRWTLIVATLVALMVGLVLSAVFSRRLSGVIVHLLRHADAIAEGDLTVSDAKVTAHDELGRLTVAINRMKQSLSATIGSAARPGGGVGSA